eukprot:CAMPEP_0174323434 /NCGR_PEP_ID=MMETSP0810-20121108/11803_1 /TAXON_ID=73025 ORGANISM="Eutreptiella gymnastica-like, Strain CCMP1594" /NCGR_SAMPLE_ID=MMETSP0810 /ASSEMBLY_ACC=CAM_ASM_000659 /LENGTH=161 /DNA_ID=CAMNT_0015435857 /DNA_START=140 /DNA_END=622 /DNA_ORIENTATION=-
MDKGSPVEKMQSLISRTIGFFPRQKPECLGQPVMSVGCDLAPRPHLQRILKMASACAWAIAFLTQDKRTQHKYPLVYPHTTPYAQRYVPTHTNFPTYACKQSGAYMGACMQQTPTTTTRVRTSTQNQAANQVHRCVHTLHKVRDGDGDGVIDEGGEGEGVG